MWAMGCQMVALNLQEVSTLAIAIFPITLQCIRITKCNNNFRVFTVRQGEPVEPGQVPTERELRLRPKTQTDGRPYEILHHSGAR